MGDNAAAADSKAKPTKRRRSWRAKLLTVVAATLFAMLCGEILVRGLGVVRNVGPSFTEWDAEDGVRLRRDFSCVRYTPEFSMTLTTNSSGRRGPEPEVGAKGSLVFLGDSFTLGYGVDDGAEFPALVRRALAPDWNVHNFGIGATGNGRWLHVLERDVPALKPRVIVMQVCGNDYDDNLNERLYQLGPDGELLAQPVPQKSMLRVLQGVIDRVPGLAYSHLVGLMRQLKSGGGPAQAEEGAAEDPATASEPKAPPGEPLTLRILTEALSWCQENQLPVLGLAVAVDPNSLGRLEELFESHGHRFLVCPDKADSPDLYYEVDGHWNARGHEWASAEILRALGQEPYRTALSH